MNNLQNYSNYYFKTIEPAPSIYAAGKVPSTIDLHTRGYGSVYPFYILIDKQINRSLPFILSVKLVEPNDTPILYSSIERTGRVFYFTINNRHEETFKYLGKSEETDPKKIAYRDTFLNASTGDKESQLQLGDMIASGIKEDSNRLESIRYYDLASNQNGLLIKTFIAFCHSNGILTKQDQEKGFNSLQNLADHHHYPEAQYQLAKHLEYGIGCKQDFNRAIHYYTLAAKQNHSKAALEIAPLSEEKCKDQNQAHITFSMDLNAYEMEHNLNLHTSIHAQYRRNLPFILSINFMHEKTNGTFYFTINNTREKSFEYLGTSLEKDEQKQRFLETFLKANKGNKEAQTKLGDLYLSGCGVVACQKEAIRYFELAAKQGSLKAKSFFHSNNDQQHNCYRRLKRLADKFNYPEAQYELAKLLELGLGCKQNLEEAIRYCTLAAKLGYKPAKIALFFYNNET